MNPLEKLEADPSSSEWLKKAAHDVQRMPAWLAVQECHALAAAVLAVQNDIVLAAAELPQNHGKGLTMKEHFAYPKGRW